MKDQLIHNESDYWLKEKGPQQHVVVSSRARLARNLPKIPFATHARQEELSEVYHRVDQVLQNKLPLKSYQPVVLHETSLLTRRYLKESHIISTEMEKGERFRLVYLSEDCHISIMVNEEDHIRIQGLVAGLQIKEILNQIIAIDIELLSHMPLAFSEQFGFLTACPTNVGTGLRISVMMHLPGLVMSRKIDEVLEIIHPLGVTVRGFYGENSEYIGDFYQISNEVTLGKTEEEIVELLLNVIRLIINKEETARNQLFKNRIISIEDSIWRSFALLSQARMMDSQEAMKLLSRIRLGIDHGYFKFLDHAKLNKLIIDIQPAHLEYTKKCEASAEARDIARASLLRNIFNTPGSRN